DSSHGGLRLTGRVSLGLTIPKRAGRDKAAGRPAGPRGGRPIADPVEDFETLGVSDPGARTISTPRPGRPTGPLRLEGAGDPRRLEGWHDAGVDVTATDFTAPRARLASDPVREGRNDPAPLQKGRLSMRSRSAVLVVIVATLVAVAVGWSIAAPKQYQF